MVREVVQEFLEQKVHLEHRDIQQCALGEAYVHLSHVRDRDWLVHNSPHSFGDVYLSFIKHNEGSNWRRVNFNRICWILMIGVPFDFINTEDIAMGVSKFGRMISWENDEGNKGRFIAKVRVTDLDEIPKSIRWSEGGRFEEDGWSSSVEVLQQELLGGGPADEDPFPPPGVDPHPIPLDNLHFPGFHA